MIHAYAIYYLVVESGFWPSERYKARGYVRPIWFCCNEMNLLLSRKIGEKEEEKQQVRDVYICLQDLRQKKRWKTTMEGCV